MTYLVFTEKPKGISLHGSFKIESDDKPTVYLRGCEDEKELTKHFANGGMVAVDCDSPHQFLRKTWSVTFTDRFTEEVVTKHFKVAFPVFQ